MSWIQRASFSRQRVALSSCLLVPPPNSALGNGGPHRPSSGRHRRSPNAQYWLHSGHQPLVGPTRSGLSMCSRGTGSVTFSDPSRWFLPAPPQPGELTHLPDSLFPGHLQGPLLAGGRTYSETHCRFPSMKSTRLSIPDLGTERGVPSTALCGALEFRKPFPRASQLHN